MAWFSSLMIDAFHGRAECVGNVDDKVVRQRSRRFVVILDATIDVGRFKDADQNRKLAFAVDFLKIDDLVFGQLGNDDPSQLHLDGHVTRFAS